MDLNTTLNKLDKKTVIESCNMVFKANFTDMWIEDSSIRVGDASHKDYVILTEKDIESFLDEQKRTSGFFSPPIKRTTCRSNDGTAGFLL